MRNPDFASILSESSRSLADYTTAMVGNDPILFNKVLDLAYEQKSPVSMRAARVADLSCELHPELIRPYLVRMVRDLPDLKDMSVKRVFMHILIRHSWVEDEEAMGKLVDTLFKWLTDDDQAIAVKAYSIAILENITKILPDLRGELILVLEEAAPVWESDALRYRARKLVRKLRKTKTEND
jgi:hypothetical protein